MRLILTLVVFLAPVGYCQSLYIDTIPEYRELPACAVVPLSTIVRDMSDGCGDDKEVTSYSCFCTNSSSEFNQIISSKVEANCSESASAVAQTALEVFASYCHLGDPCKSDPSSFSWRD